MCRTLEREEREREKEREYDDDSFIYVERNIQGWLRGLRLALN